MRYIGNSPSIKVVLARTPVVGLLGGAILALLPLVTRDRLQGGAGLYGMMLGAFGVGAVLGALNLTRLRKHLGAEAAVSACTIAMGMGFAAVAVSHTPVLTMAALSWRAPGGRWHGRYSISACNCRRRAGCRGARSRPTRRQAQAGLP